jgi:hypothetical protein
MSDLDGLRREASRLGLELTDADLEGIAKLLRQTRDGVRALGPLPTEWLEPDYRFVPIEAAPKEESTAAEHSPPATSR